MHRYLLLSDQSNHVNFCATEAYVEINSCRKGVIVIYFFQPSVIILIFMLQNMRQKILTIQQSNIGDLLVHTV